MKQHLFNFVENSLSEQKLNFANTEFTKKNHLASTLNNFFCSILFLFNCQKFWKRKTICSKTRKAFQNYFRKVFAPYLLIHKEAMSFHLLSDQNNDWERTILYKTLRKPCTFYPTITTNEKEENWTALEHFMIPKNFVNFIVTLLNKEESEDVKIAMEDLSLQAGSFHVCSYYILFTRMALRRCQKNSNHS